MTQRQSIHESRRRVAHDAWAALPHRGRDAIRLQVQCARSHHVATVYDTAAGWVVVAPVRAHSHGSRDRIDQPHGGHPVESWTDLIAPVDDPLVDDAVPAWCDCGQRALSRATMLEWMAAGERKVLID